MLENNEYGRRRTSAFNEYIAIEEPPPGSPKFDQPGEEVKERALSKADSFEFDDGISNTRKTGFDDEEEATK